MRTTLRYHYEVSYIATCDERWLAVGAWLGGGPLDLKDSKKGGPFLFPPNVRLVAVLNYSYITVSSSFTELQIS